MSRWMSILVIIVVAGCVWAVDFGTVRNGHAAVNDPITCSAPDIAQFNTFSRFSKRSLRFDEVSNLCRPRALDPCFSGVTPDAWVLCYNTFGGFTHLRHDGVRFINFKIDGGPPLAPNTDHIVDANGGSHTITYTDTVDGENRTLDITINVDGKRIDALSSVTTVVADITPPTVAITGVPGVTDGATAFTATFTFNEDVTGFDLADINAALTNGAATAFATTTANRVFTATITPNGAGNTVVGVNANAAIDTATNGNTAATNQTATLDNTDPTVAITGAVAIHDGATPFLATVTFSEPVTGFIAGELTATNAAVGPLAPATGIVTVFTATITPAGPGVAITLDVAAAVAKDVVLNDNTAAATLTVGAAGASVEETQKVNASLMSNRAGHFLNNQPNFNPFNGGFGTGSGQPGTLALNGNADGMNLAFATSRSQILAAQSGLGSGISQGSGFGPLMGSTTSGGAPIAGSPLMSFAPASQAGVAEAQLTGLDNNPVIDPLTGELVAVAVTDQTNEQAALSTYSDDRTGSWDIWAEIYGSMSSAGASESTLWVGYVGAHIFVSPDTIVGIMGQLDWADETNSTVGSNADGMGWMIGPYVAGRVPGQNLYYEARAAWGRSDNNVSPIGTYTDGFETERWMALAKLEGAYEMGNLTIRPAARIAWYEETQESYTDTNALFIPSQTISLGEFRFGPNFVWDMLLDDGTLFQPNIGVAGVFNFGLANNVASQGFALGDDDLRARFEAGFSATNPMGLILTATGFYDGVGVDNYYSYGGSVRLTVPLN